MAVWDQTLGRAKNELSALESGFSRACLVIESEKHLEEVRYYDGKPWTLLEAHSNCADVIPMCFSDSPNLRALSTVQTELGWYSFFTDTSAPTDAIRDAGSVSFGLPDAWKEKLNVNKIVSSRDDQAVWFFVVLMLCEIKERHWPLRRGFWFADCGEHMQIIESHDGFEPAPPIPSPPQFRFCNFDWVRNSLASIDILLDNAPSEFHENDTLDWSDTEIDLWTLLEDGSKIKRVRLANKLGITEGAVSRIIRQLNKRGFRVDNNYREGDPGFFRPDKR